MAEQGTCFVIMGFGKKTDFETGRTLDLDKSYKNMIKPAVEAAGLKCVRADEIVHSGAIDVPMYEQILNADVVVADLSTSNKNAFYELGVRHALRPHTTVIIAEDGMKTFPFDLNHIVIRQYHHLGEDIGYSEVVRFQELLRDAIKQITAQNPRTPDSPVYTFVKGLVPPSVAEAVAEVTAAVADAVAPAPAQEAAQAQSHSVLMEQVDAAQEKGDFVTAKALLGVVRGMMKAQAPNRPEDPYILQRLALVTYKSRLPTEEESLREACDILWSLDPQTSNDTETLGLWAAVHKRLWALTHQQKDLDKAVRAVERGFYLRNDHYNGINLAFLLNLRASGAADPAEAVADFVQAKRIRREVLAICEKWVAENPAPDAAALTPEALDKALEARYWMLATRAEAAIGLEDPRGDQLLQEAYAAAPHPWMTESTQDQVKKLRDLLAHSPLKTVAPAAPPAPAPAPPGG